MLDCRISILTCPVLCAGGRKGKGRGGGGGGGGGSGRGVRGVDFGLGIGYNPESNNTSSNTIPNRSAAVNSLRTGMMSQFRSNFVAASSNSNQGFSSNTSMGGNRRPALPGFVSGGSIGGDINAHKNTASSPASSAVNSTRQNSGVNPVQNSSNRFSKLNLLHIYLNVKTIWFADKVIVYLSLQF